MTDAHIFSAGLMIGGLISWVIFVGIHKRSIKAIEDSSMKALDDLGQKAKESLTSLAELIKKEISK